MIERKQVLLLLFFLMIFGLGACDFLDPQPTPTPLFVTATPRFVIVTNTPTPSPSPVLAPTLPQNSENGDAGSLPTATQFFASATPQITLTRTFTPTPTNTPATPGAVLAPVGGVPVANDAGASGGQIICSTLPQAGFGTIYSANSQIANLLGCPLGSGSGFQASNAYQTFENGIMLWVSSVGETGQSAIYAIFNNGTYQRFNDTWQEGVEPASLGLTPPNGMFEPIRGFGKVWRDASGVRDGLGWATSIEIGGSSVTLALERGDMVFVTQNGQTYALVTGSPATWQSFAQGY